MKAESGHLQKSEKREDARLAMAKRLYHCHLRCEMAQQSHLKSVLQVAQAVKIKWSKSPESVFSIRKPGSQERIRKDGLSPGFLVSWLPGFLIITKILSGYLRRGLSAL